MGVNDVAVVVGAVQDEYNGQKSITAVTANTFDYTISGTPTTPATGTITTTGAVVSGLTNVDGEISDTRTWSSAQPITGVIRSGTSTPFYKPSGITGIISTTLGISTTNVLIRDD
jgi:hypothetical protein